MLIITLIVLLVYLNYKSKASSKIEDLTNDLSREMDERALLEGKYNKLITDLKNKEDLKRGKDLDEMQLLFTKVNMLDDKLTFFSSTFKSKLDEVVELLENRKENKASFTSEDEDYDDLEDLEDNEESNDDTEEDYEDTESSSDEEDVLEEDIENDEEDEDENFVDEEENIKTEEILNNKPVDRNINMDDFLADSDMKFSYREPENQETVSQGNENHKENIAVNKDFTINNELNYMDESYQDQEKIDENISANTTPTNVSTQQFSKTKEDDYNDIEEIEVQEDHKDNNISNNILHDEELDSALKELNNIKIGIDDEEDDTQNKNIKVKDIQQVANVVNILEEDQENSEAIMKELEGEEGDYEDEEEYEDDEEDYEGDDGDLDDDSSDDEGVIKKPVNPNNPSAGYDIKESVEKLKTQLNDKK